MLSNVLVSFAGSAHLKELDTRPGVVAALASRGIALTVRLPFAVICPQAPLKLDYRWAGPCILGAVYLTVPGSFAAT